MLFWHLNAEKWWQRL